MATQPTRFGEGNNQLDTRDQPIDHPDLLLLALTSHTREGDKTVTDKQNLSSKHSLPPQK